MTPHPGNPGWQPAIRLLLQPGARDHHSSTHLCGSASTAGPDYPRFVLGDYMEVPSQGAQVSSNGEDQVRIVRGVVLQQQDLNSEACTNGKLQSCFNFYLA